MTTPLTDLMIVPMTDPMTYPITDRVTDPMTDVMINSVTGHLTKLTKIVMGGQFRTVAMFNIISREENIFGDRPSERHSVVLFMILNMCNDM